jgi:dTDP-4-amino-4,6-dideoxygalactose transaminase
LYVVETRQPGHRDALLQYLNDAGIDVNCHYPIHQQEGYPWGHPARLVSAIPKSERHAACCISLPMFPELTEEEVDYAIEKVLAWDRSAR